MRDDGRYWYGVDDINVQALSPCSDSTNYLQSEALFATRRQDIHLGDILLQDIHVPPCLSVGVKFFRLSAIVASVLAVNRVVPHTTSSRKIEVI